VKRAAVLELMISGKLTIIERATWASLVPPPNRAL
jgi:hypothetical protein